MTNNIDFYLHKSHEPPYYQRQFEHDLPKADEGGTKRILLIALPFLSLYQPFGKTISFMMGSVRTLTCGADALQADGYQALAYKTGQLALAGIALAATFYHFTLGLFVTTGADLLTNLAHLASHLSAREFEKGGEELLLALSGGLYLAIMVMGTLEVVLASILVQALVSFYQARGEWAEGRVPEALAKTLMGMIRLYQAKCQFTLIQRRNALMAQYEAFAARIQKGRDIDHLWDHPLINQDSHFVIKGPNGEIYDTGAHTFGYGKGLVKGMNLTRSDENTLEFKVNHVHKDRLEGLVDELNSMNQEDINTLLNSLGSHVEGVHIERSAIPQNGNSFVPLGDQRHIHLEGLGTITLGASEGVLTLYDKVTVKMDEGKTLYDFHEALSFLNLDDALRASAREDLNRMKMGQLFRTFDPRGALDFERSDPYFDFPLDDFKSAILEKNPEMGPIFDSYLDKMEVREVFPGSGRYAMNGLSDDLQAHGAKGLTASLTGVGGDKESYDRIGSILENGMLSSEARHNSGMHSNGLSWGVDYYTGGADTVFTQVVTDKNKNYDDFDYYNDLGGVRLTFSPKLFETGTYQYHDDNFGTRIVDTPFWWWADDYRNRPNVFEFLEEERRHFSAYNEVMVKERIPPEYITGVIVSNQKQKDFLLDSLRQRDIVQTDTSGQETILSKKVDDFIFVGNRIKDAQFA